MIKCDKCGCCMTEEFYADGKGEGGHCDLCGRDLCADCAGEWEENGECMNCVQDALHLAWKVKNGISTVQDDKIYTEINARGTSNHNSSRCDQCWEENGECESCRNTHGEGMKLDEGKLRWDLLPWGALEQVVRVLTYGANKYSDNNWQKVKDAKKRYEAALMRHFKAHVTGETTSEENGVELWHIAQVACNALFLLWFEQAGYPKED